MKNYKLLMNQITLVLGLLFFLLTAVPLTLGQVVNPVDNNTPTEIPFRFTYLMSDKSIYVSGETVEFEAWIVNNSTEHDLAIYLTANSPFISDDNPATRDTITSDTVIIPKNTEGSIKVLLPSQDERYGRQILRVNAYATSTSDETLTAEEVTLFQVQFEEKPVSRIPLIGFILVIAIVAGFVLRSTRSELSDIKD